MWGDRQRFPDRELGALFERVDERLRAAGVPIPNRPLRAGLEVHREIGEPVRLFAERTGRPTIIFRNGKLSLAVYRGDFSPNWPADHVGARLNEWYERRYGDRLKRQWDVGQVVVPIRGGLWRGHICLFFGTLRLCCVPEVVESPRMVLSAPGRPLPPIIANVLDVIDDLPMALRQELDAAERGAILEIFRLGFECYYAFDAVDRQPLIAAALRDHGSAVDHLLIDTPHYGLSKWASLQAAEKTLKAALEVRGVAFPRSHKLDGVAALAAARVGFPPIPAHVLKQIQCPAGVRYGDGPPVSADDALLAHHAALEIGRLAGAVFGRGVACAANPGTGASVDLRRMADRPKWAQSTARRVR